MATAETEHQAAVEAALTMADADAGWRDYDDALKWLDAAEELDGALPPEYVTKRLAWEELVSMARGRALARYFEVPD